MQLAVTGGELVSKGREHMSRVSLACSPSAREEEGRNRIACLLGFDANCTGDCRLACPGEAVKPEDRWRVWVIDPISDCIDNCNACILEA